MAGSVPVTRKENAVWLAIELLCQVVLAIIAPHHGCNVVDGLGFLSWEPPEITPGEGGDNEIIYRGKLGVEVQQEPTRPV
jgi:hypothetical protein